MAVPVEPRSVEPWIRIKNSELILHFDIKCSLRLGSFPGCPTTSRSLPRPKSRQLGIIASTNFDWSDSWVIHSNMSAEQAVEITQDGIVLNELASEMLDEQPTEPTQATGNNSMTENGSWNIFIIILISSLF